MTTLTRDDIRITDWHAEDGSSYRAAVHGEAVLTLPEHATLDDDALIAEALQEAARASLYRQCRDCGSTTDVSLDHGVYSCATCKGDVQRPS